MAGPLLLGVNLAGAEFGSNVPGVFGTDYTYPTHTEIDYYAAKGMSVVRLPFLWERVQRSENAPLDAVELARLDDVVSYATGKGLKIEIRAAQLRLRLPCIDRKHANTQCGLRGFVGQARVPLPVQSRRHVRADERAA